MIRDEPKMLIEVAMPVKEVSAESVRDKSIRHGHISTLHLWWARRPLPVCRAVVFASLVPDPLDENCPQSFRDAVETLLGTANNIKDGDPYRPYDDIPFTAAIDPMEDNLRNRLLMFIGKFSDTFIRNEKEGKKTAAKDQICSFSLIKWDNKNNETIINKARKLIWVAHDPGKNTLELFDSYYGAIKKAEQNLYNTPDRHLETSEVKAKEAALEQAIDSFLDRMPKVFDPFAGGGAIPLEASRLGCRTYANDLNPVAHIIEKGSLEFPQKYGKPIIYSKEAFISLYGEEVFNAIPNDKKVYNNGKVSGVRIKNRLAFDVEFYARKLLKMAEEEIGHFYPADEEGNKPIAYYWSRVATCANPACKARVPLLKQFYLVNKKDKKIYLKPIIDGTRIDFEIKKGTINIEGWNYRGNLKCPCCGNTTDVKQIKEQNISGLLKEKILAVIYDGKNGKEYRLPRQYEIEVLKQIPKEIENFRPIESMQRNSAGGDTFSWGVNKWGQLFSERQLLTLQAFVNKFQEIKNELSPDNNDYSKALVTYLGILVNRITPSNTTYGRWHISGEKIEHLFARQAIPMIFDFPESNPLSNSTGSSFNQLYWIIQYLESENNYPFKTECRNSSSGDITQFKSKYLSVVITDPPYYDAIAYADLSDFFYVWLKRTVSDFYPLNFAYPQTPKSEECTALKHHYSGCLEKAKQHFEDKLRQIFEAIEKQTQGVVTIMFAHQSTEAWTTLCNSILKARMNITGSWAIDTELGNRMVAMEKAALASSVTVSCRPYDKSGYGDYKGIKQAIESKVKDEVKFLYKMGFRGSDLLTACFGKAVSEFGKYKKVEKADGTPVTVAELLEMAKDAAFNAIVSDIETDDISRFYIGWLNLFGFTQTDHDDVRRITQIGLNIDANDLLTNHILVRAGSKENLADYKQRIKANPRLGENPQSHTIDKVHKAMHLYTYGNRSQLVYYIADHAGTSEHHFWRVLNALVEILPHGSDDHKEASGLITNKENLIRESKHARKDEERQMKLFQ